jgi:hypothetical protein
MTDPRRHHYVPQFYLNRFTNASSRFWVWDKTKDRVFTSSPTSIAVELDFYKIHDFVALGHDPYVMEKQLAEMEGEVSLITSQWVDWLRHIKSTEKIDVPNINRQIVSRFVALQFLRTADTRDIFSAIYQEKYRGRTIDKHEQALAYTDMLWDLDLVNDIAKHVEDAVWIFARNLTSTPFITSDNPVAFRTSDNRMWLKAGFLGKTYTVYPLAPDIMMYCHGGEHYDALKRFDLSLSPVELDAEMIESENSGQVFMAGRFLVSPVNDFRHAREFAATIGTDKYADDR